MMKKRYYTLFCIIMVLCMASVSMWGCGKSDNTKTKDKEPAHTDYSKTSSWLQASAGVKPVDCFYIYPTVTMQPEKGKQNISLKNEEHRKGADYCIVAQASVYAESCNLFVPYYQQMNMETYSLPEKQLKEAASIAYADVKAAFEYFLANLNNDRPFIIAGHSQGSIMTSMLLADVMKDETIKSRMVAAYAIGWPITQEYMDSNPHLLFASGADDTGVIISFNTCSEAPAEKNLLSGGICINPINWKTDETPALASENLGSVFFDESSYEKTEEENYADATIDLERGTVVCKTITDNNKYAISQPRFPDEIYHMTEYGFYYKNLQQNVENRIQNYLKQ